MSFSDLTGEASEELSDEERAEIELQKLRGFKSRLKSMGVVEVVPDSETKDQP